MSFAYKYLMSGIAYLNIANLSSPVPNANPPYCFGSYPFIFNTFGCTIPAPSTSIHPVCLHKLHPFPPHLKQLTSTSYDGSVNGK